MPSTYTGLGTQLMETGENAGTWGTKTNTNLNIIEQIAGGYIAVDINGGAQTTTLAVSDGSTGAALANRVIEFTGAITPADQVMGLTGQSATITLGNLGIQHYQDVDTGSNTSYTNVGTGSNTSYSEAA